MIDWREVDGQLRNLAVRRAALDAQEARLLREAERLQIWRPLGMVSALDYMERVLGYAPHAAMERLRVARALESLPVLEGALDSGQLNFSAVRELTRIATPSTEEKWCQQALGKNVRQIEQLVAGHAHGDDPDDPVNPTLQRHKVTLDLSADVYARWRQTQTVVAEERGERPDDDAFATELVEARLERGAGEPTGRAKFQIMMTICEHCERGWQDGSGRRLLVDAATVERAKCDAQYIGSTEDDVPVRASQDIPPSVVRFVWHRDGGVCQTPGCRSSRGLEVHHIVPRALGGGHEPSNLRLQCSACHSAIHRGTLDVLDGEAHRPNEPSDVGSIDVAVASHASHVGSMVVPVAGSPAFDAAAARARARDARAALDVEARPDAPSHVGSMGVPVAGPRAFDVARARDASAAFDVEARPDAPSQVGSMDVAVASNASHIAGSPAFDAAAARVRARDARAALDVEARPNAPSGEATGAVAGPPAFDAAARARDTRVVEAPPPNQSHVGSDESTPLDSATMRWQVRDALVGLGWKSTVARGAVDLAMSHVGRDAPIETVIREALRWCRRAA